MLEFGLVVGARCSNLIVYGHQQVTNAADMRKMNYLAGNSPIEKRNKNDFYQTPYHCTRLLLDTEKFSGSILEPAAGKNAIVKVLWENNYRPTYYDIESGVDFLKEKGIQDVADMLHSPEYQDDDEIKRYKAESRLAESAQILTDKAPLYYINHQP